MTDAKMTTEIEAKINAKLADDAKYQELKKSLLTLYDTNKEFDEIKPQLERVKACQIKQQRAQFEQNEINLDFERKQEYLTKSLEGESKVSAPKDPSASGQFSGHKYRKRGDGEVTLIKKERYLKEAKMTEEQKEVSRQQEAKDLETQRAEKLKKAEEESKLIDAEYQEAFEALNAVLKKLNINPKVVESELERINRELQKVTEELLRIEAEAKAAFIKVPDRSLKLLKDDINNAGGCIMSRAPNAKSNEILQKFQYTLQVIEDPRKEDPENPVSKEQKDTYRGTPAYVCWSHSRGQPIMLRVKSYNPVIVDYHYYYEQCSLKVYESILDEVGGKKINTRLAGSANTDAFANV